MATRKRRRKCKLGYRRDGKCRTTRCPVKLTKKRLCPKNATHAGTKRRRSYGGKRRRSSSSKRRGSTLLQRMTALAKYDANLVSRPPAGALPTRGDPLNAIRVEAAFRGRR